METRTGTNDILHLEAPFRKSTGLREKGKDPLHKRENYAISRGRQSPRSVREGSSWGTGRKEVACRR